MLAACLAAASLAAATPLRAQTSTEQFVHWAYAPYFGTGSYDVGDSQELFAVRIAKRFRIREAAIAEDGGRRTGIALRLPVTIGTQHDFASLGGLFDAGNVSAVSVVPGAEFEIPVTERLRLKPMVYAGWGTQLGGGDSAWIYWAGLRSQRAFQNEKLDWRLVNSLLVVGYTSAGVPSESVMPLLTGFEFQKPLTNVRLGGDQIYLNWSVAYTKYVNSLDFRIGPASVPSLVVDDEWEVALAFSKGATRLKLWRFEVDRLGLAYRFGTDGEFSGIGLIFRSLFDR